MSTKEKLIERFRKQPKDFTFDKLKPRKGFSGSLNVKIPTEIHSKIALLTEKSGISINAFVKKILEERVHAFTS